MATNSESSFGARLKNANDLITYIRGFQEFNPPRPEEQPDALAGITASANQLNSEVAAKRSTYKTAVSQRLGLFKTNPDSLTKRLSPIYKAIGAQYGKNSNEFKQVASLIRVIRSTPLKSPPAPTSNNGQSEDKISQSQRSFGSMSQHFAELVETLKSFESYAVSNQDISVESLTMLLDNISTANTAVASAYQELNNVKKNRIDTYSDLSDRIQRVKMYVSSHYGNSSREYKLISKLKV